MYTVKIVWVKIVFLKVKLPNLIFEPILKHFGKTPILFVYHINVAPISDG